MKYIILAAGKGSRLHPLTLKYPKSLYKLDKYTSVLQRTVKLIQKYDNDSEIIVVTGFMHTVIENSIDNVTFVRNPFYDVTNSIASLWFAKEYMKDSCITIINGDVVMEESLINELITETNEEAYVLVDSSIKTEGDYNVQVSGKKVLVMSKELNDYFGEYAGVTKLAGEAIKLLYDKVEEMIWEGMYDQWYENAMVQMIFNEDFNLFYRDISNYKWTEIDCVSNMLLAKQIHIQSDRGE